MEEFKEIKMDDDSDCEDDNSDFEVSLSDYKEFEEVELHFRHRKPGDSAVVFDFTPPYKGANTSIAPEINAESSPFSIFITFFEEVIRIMWQETNRYYQQFCTHQGTSNHQPDVSYEEIYKFLALVIQMGHSQREEFKDYWCKDEQFYTPFYHKTMTRDRFLHILRFIHFTDNNFAPSKEDPNYDKLWKIRNVFDTLNNKFSELYYPTENIAIDEMKVLYKGRVIFQGCIPKKLKNAGIKIYKLVDSLGYTSNMSVYLAGRTQPTGGIFSFATHGVVQRLVRKVEGVGHKLFMDSNFSSPLLFEDLMDRKINCCGIVRYNTRGMPKDLHPTSNMKLKRGDIVTRVKDKLCVVRWKNIGEDLYLLTNMHSPPVEGNFVDASGNPIKPQVLEDFNKQMGLLNKSYGVVNNYGIARKRWKWTKKLFFHLLDITIVNAFVVHKSVGGSMILKKFRETLVRELITEAHELNVKESVSLIPDSNQGRPSLVTGQLSRLEVKHSKHWPSRANRRRCRVCSLTNKRRTSAYCCKQCDVGLCVEKCFEIWHTCSKIK